MFWEKACFEKVYVLKEVCFKKKFGVKRGMFWEEVCFEKGLFYAVLDHSATWKEAYILRTGMFQTEVCLEEVHFGKRGYFCLISNSMLHPANGNIACCWCFVTCRNHSYNTELLKMQVFAPHCLGWSFYWFAISLVYHFDSLPLPWLMIVVITTALVYQFLGIKLRTYLMNIIKFCP